MIPRELYEDVCCLISQADLGHEIYDCGHEWLDPDCLACEAEQLQRHEVERALKICAALATSLPREEDPTECQARWAESLCQELEGLL